MMQLNHHSEEYLAKKLRNPEHRKRLERIVLGETIRRLRIRKRMKQAELAHTLDTTQSVVSRIEQGRQNLTLSMLQKIADIFGKKVIIKIQ